MTEQAKEKPLSLRDTIAPKSDQLNYDDLIAGCVRVRVVGLAKGSPDQPVIVKIVNWANNEEMRPYKPCKSMRRVLVAAWGDQGKDWIGKEIMLVGDPSVSFGGQQVGGIRISHLSHLREPMRIMLTTTRSKRTVYSVGVIEIKEAKEVANG